MRPPKNDGRDEKNPSRVSRRRLLAGAAAGITLPPDQVYSLVAYLLYLNEVVPEHAVLDQDSLPEIVMPARDRFVIDNRRGGAEIR